MTPGSNTPGSGLRPWAACRGLNLLLGMSHAAAFGGQFAWLAAAGYGIFVAGITLASRSEAFGGGRKTLVAGLIFQFAAIVTLATVGFSARRFPNSSTDRPIIPLEGLLVLALVALVASVAGSRAIERPIPENIQKYVKTSILSLVWLHVGVLAAVRGPALALAARRFLGAGLPSGPMALFDVSSAAIATRDCWVPTAKPKRPEVIVVIACM